MNAGADAVVRGDGAGVQLRGEAFATGDEPCFLLCGTFDDLLELLLLGGEILLTDGDAVGEFFDGLLVFFDLLLCVGDVLLVDLAEKVGIFEFLADGVVLAAVGDVFQLTAVLGDVGVVLDCAGLGSLDDEVLLGNGLLDAGYLGAEAFELLFEGLHLGGKFAAELNQLLDFVVGLLEVIEDLEFLFYCSGFCKILLQGYESLPLVDGSFHLLYCLLGCCHIFSDFLLLIQECKVMKKFRYFTVPF